MPDSNGLILLSPSSVAVTGAGSSASISANGSVSFSSCATVSFNSIFSSTYDEYMLVGHVDRTTGTGNLLRLVLNLRNGTTNESDSSWSYQELRASSTSITAGRITGKNTMFINEFLGTQTNGIVINISGPYLARRTSLRTMNVEDAVSDARIEERIGTHNKAVSYDGFTLTEDVAGVPFSGRLSVYGLRK